MSKEQVIKDKLVLIVKNAITANIDRLAEQIAEEVYEMFEPASIDEPGPRGKEGCFSIDKPGGFGMVEWKSDIKMISK